MADDDAFLSRWSRRKALARQGQPLAEPPPEPPASMTPPAVVPPPVVAPEPPGPEPVAAPPPPTLEDVESLPRDAADFSRFVARDVPPEVKSAALKKLFSDPQFNVMDGLDIYIDDYSRPDPLPASMLRQMVQGRFLGLFSEEAQPPAAQSAAAASTDNPEPAPAAVPGPVPDEDADLRLQQDDPAGRPGPEAGAGESAQRQP